MPTGATPTSMWVASGAACMRAFAEPSAHSHHSSTLRGPMPAAVQRWCSSGARRARAGFIFECRMMRRGCSVRSREEPVRLPVMNSPVSFIQLFINEANNKQPLELHACRVSKALDCALCSLCYALCSLHARPRCSLLAGRRTTHHAPCPPVSLSSSATRSAPSTRRRRRGSSRARRTAVAMVAVVAAAVVGVVVGGGWGVGWW